MLKSVLKGAGRDALVYLPVRFLPALTALVTVPVFTRLIGAEDYGYYYLVTSASSFATTVATAWLTPSVVRFYWSYEREGRLDDYTGTTMWLSLLSIALVTIVAGVAVFAVSPFLAPGLARLVPAALAGFAANAMMQVFLQVQRAANRAIKYAWLSVAVTLASTAGSLALVWAFGLGSLGIVLGALTGNLVVLPFALRQMSTHGALTPVHARRDVAREYVTYGMPFIAANLSSWALVMADRYIIEWLRTSAEVGLYSVAYGLGERILQLITIPLVMTMGPVMIQTFEKNGQELASRVQTQFTRYYLLATVPLVFGLAAVAETFMGVFTGAEYRPAYPVLWIVSASVLLYGLTQIAGTGVALHKRSRIIMSNTMAAALLNVAGNIVVVPTFGYLGAAWMTLASYLFLLLLTWLRSRPFMSWRIPWPSVLRIMVSGGVMFAIVSLASPSDPTSLPHLIGQVVLGMAAYIAVILLIREIREDERAAVVDFVQRRRGRAD